MGKVSGILLSNTDKLERYWGYPSNKQNEQNQTIKQLNDDIIPMYIRILFISWSQFALSYSLMYVINEIIIFYNILI